MTDAKLTITGRPQGTDISGPGPWVLGRSPEADVQFPSDPGCSRLQARIARKGAAFTLENLSRSFPTSIDGRAVDGVAGLRDGALISFSNQRMEFRLVSPAPAAAGQPARAQSPTDTMLAEPIPDALELDRSLTVGREHAPGQVVFGHPGVSRRHAAFDVGSGTVVVRDLGSTNGTYVNGERLDRPRRLAPGDRIDIGPYQLTFDGKRLVSATRSGNVDLSVTNIGFDVRAARDRKPLRILDAATLYIPPRELVCIIGASGSGKSTLMNILAGRAIPSEGQVRLNGVDLHRNFDALKQDIAFVPQQDVLHEQLTLREALTYAAKLRLPPDTSREQCRTIVETAARGVDLFELLDNRIGSLSGGQKKRASLASEILNRPSLLFLDEVTSGLDESTDWEIMRLLRRLTDEGMTIVVVTHTLANVEEFCHRVVCMGRGGHITFVGSPADALGFFGMRRLGEVFNRIEFGGVESWRDRYRATIAQNVASAAPDGAGGVRLARRREPLPQRAARILRQFGILVHRNTRLLLKDHRTLAMAAVQSCLIGGLMGYAFGDFGAGQEAISGKNALLFLLGLTSIWLGCNGASKDIVGELVIYKRERDINLSTAAFVGAKYLVTGLFTVLQLAVVFLLTAALAQRIPGAMGPQLGILVLGAMAGTAIGLVISAFANTRDQATTIVPLALVPQIILAGILVPHLPALADDFARVAVSSFWLTEAMKSIFIAGEGPIHVINAISGRPVEMTAEPAARGAAIVAAHAAVFLLIAYLAALLRHGGRQSGA